MCQHTQKKKTNKELKHKKEIAKKLLYAYSKNTVNRCVEIVNGWKAPQISRYVCQHARCSNVCMRTGLLYARTETKFIVSKQRYIYTLYVVWLQHDVHIMNTFSENSQHRFHQ